MADEILDDYQASAKVLHLQLSTRAVYVRLDKLDGWEVDLPRDPGEEKFRAVRIYFGGQSVKFLVQKIEYQPFRRHLDELLKG